MSKPNRDASRLIQLDNDQDDQQSIENREQDQTQYSRQQQHQEIDMEQNLLLPVNSIHKKSSKTNNPSLQPQTASSGLHQPTSHSYTSFASAKTNDDVATVHQHIDTAVSGVGGTLQQKKTHASAKSKQSPTMLLDNLDSRSFHDDTFEDVDDDSDDNMLYKTVLNQSVSNQSSTNEILLQKLHTAGLVDQTKQKTTMYSINDSESSSSRSSSLSKSGSNFKYNTPESLWNVTTNNNNSSTSQKQLPNKFGNLNKDVSFRLTEDDQKFMSSVPPELRQIMLSNQESCFSVLSGACSQMFDVTEVNDNDDDEDEDDDEDNDDDDDDDDDDYDNNITEWDDKADDPVETINDKIQCTRTPGMNILLVNDENQNKRETLEVANSDELKAVASKNKEDENIDNNDDFDNSAKIEINISMHVHEGDIEPKKTRKKKKNSSIIASTTTVVEEDEEPSRRSTDGTSIATGGKSNFSERLRIASSAVTLKQSIAAESKGKESRSKRSGGNGNRTRSNSGSPMGSHRGISNKFFPNMGNKGTVGIGGNSNKVPTSNNNKNDDDVDNSSIEEEDLNEINQLFSTVLGTEGGDPGSNEQQQQQQQQQRQIHIPHQKRISILRIIMFVIIISLGILYTLGARYVTITSIDKTIDTIHNQMTIQFIQSTMQQNFQTNLERIQAFVDDISHSIIPQFDNPNSVLHQFGNKTEILHNKIGSFVQASAHKLRDQMNGTILVAIAPLMTTTTNETTRSEESTLSNSIFHKLFTNTSEAQVSNDKNISPFLPSSDRNPYDLHLYHPIWQLSPVLNISLYNMTYDIGNLYPFPANTSVFELISKNQIQSLPTTPFTQVIKETISKHNELTLIDSADVMDDYTLGVFFQPIMSTTNQTIGVLLVVQKWDAIFQPTYIPASFDDDYVDMCDVDVVVGWSADTTKQITYRLTLNIPNKAENDISPVTIKLNGVGDLHDLSFTNTKKTFQLNSDEFDSLNGYTQIHLYAASIDTVYDSSMLNESLYMVSVSLLFTLCISLLIYYERILRRRHNRTYTHAIQSSALVASIFPEQVHERLMQNRDGKDVEKPTRNKSIFAGKLGGDTARRSLLVNSNPSTRAFSFVQRNTNSNASVRQPPKLRLKSLLRTQSTLSAETDFDKPIADYFPDCTIMFADIVDFTAWSSTCDPIKVFTLLQNVFFEFDKAAKKRGVFKVETIGASYVAVCGLPQPQKDHALIMAGFALECRMLMKEVTRSLEDLLGPNTRDLKAKFGLHSGPVIAGVLKGAKARFQLFGDTMNTASRMETTSIPDRVQISDSTAELIIAAGKGDMICQRAGTVTVKGKGEMKTHFLEVSAKARRRLSAMGTTTTDSDTDATAGVESNATTGTTTDSDVTPTYTKKERSPSNEWLDWSSTRSINGPIEVDDRQDRLIDWNVNLLAELLKKVVAQRLSSARKKTSSNNKPINADEEQVFLSENCANGKKLVDDMTEVIALPEFDAEMFESSVDPATVKLNESVMSQLHEYVTIIASSYRDNPFHNYEHACHVQTSIVKLLERVTTPEQINYDGPMAVVASDAHDYTYGIASDALTQFAVVFCSLIHDVDHAGISNAQLITENANIATVYAGQSIAEQNSIDISWGILMEADFTDLRQCIYSNRTEFLRFRQLVVNVVLATDIFDKELSALRKKRWNEAFYELPQTDSTHDRFNRKATIVIEHLIQASDVAHTMQHWNVYRKWNESLFFEMYLAYETGRSDKDPSVGWYNGELWFFDNYVIPLAKKLNDCSVFGVSSEECLNYAMENRAQWKLEGESIVKELMESEFCANLRKSNSLH